MAWRRETILKYGKAEVEAQIKGLKDNGIDEYLLWNAGNRYSPGVNYKPVIKISGTHIVFPNFFY